MKAKQNKISAIEELRIKKARLKVEEKRHLHELDKHFSYLHENFGSLLLDAGWSGIKAQLHISALTYQVLDFVPVVFKELKPLLIAFALKKIKKLILK